MAKLAIKGHKTRGKEVIEILEMLGGKWKFFQGYSENHYYTVGQDSNISVYYIHDEEQIQNYKKFTLEEFLEKYPYKVGDKVIFDGTPMTITKMAWESNSICYKLNDKFYTNEMDKLQPHITAEKIINEAVNAEGDKPKEFHDTIALTIPYGYEFCHVDEKDSQIIFKKIKP